MSVSWQVVSQRQTSTFQNGVFEDAIAVTARTSDGVVFTVTVPKTQYTKDNVAKLLDAQAATISEVHSLSSESPSSSPPSSSGSS